eukprot:COSAG01_NODE_1006_length_12163_cov_237.845669_3_plen_103_part_00
MVHAPPQYMDRWVDCSTRGQVAAMAAQAPPSGSAAARITSTAAQTSPTCSGESPCTAALKRRLTSAINALSCGGQRGVSAGYPSPHTLRARASRPAGHPSDK